MLNNTEELENKTKYSLSTLYDDAKNKINNLIYFSIAEYAFFYIDIFYRRNKYTFSNNYITYYKNKLNEYELDIHQLNEVIDEIMYDGTFNKTLNITSDELMTKLVLKMNDTINELINTKFSQINSTLEDLRINMENILNNVRLSEDNQIINNINDGYKSILLNQNNQFIFKVSDLPFEKLNSFVKNVLEPPILEIKSEYNIIEQQILGKL